MTQDELWLLKEKYNGKKTEGFFADSVRLAAGEPLAYLLGSIPFLHTIIHLDSRPLIPRTETEFWVEKIIQEMQSNLDRDKTSIKILDLCAGSGCVGVAVLKDVPFAHVDFAEIDVRHHTTIQKNISENQITPTQTQIFGGSLFEHITEKYDYILTNPPYIDPSRNRATASVQTFEPSIALYGGKEGTELIFKIIAQAPDFLTERGTLVIEHEPEQTESLHSYAKFQGFAYSTLPDQYGTLRYTVLVRK